MVTARDIRKDNDDEEPKMEKHGQTSSNGTLSFRPMILTDSSRAGKLGSQTRRRARGEQG